MTLRVVREAAQGDPTVLAWHVEPRVLLDCIPPTWGLQTDCGGAYATLDLAPVRAAGDVVLVGWSAGCQAVRGALLAGVRPLAVLALDGTSASMPPARWQLQTWRDAISAGRAGEMCCVLTATQQTYVEALPIGQRYASTVRIVSDAWGAVGMLPAGAYSDRGATVEVHASATIDAAAHVREQREHGPRLIRDVIVPWVLGHRATEPSPAPTRRTMALAAARTELAANVRELPPGSNTSPRIREYLAPCIRDGRRLGLATAPWCAAFASWCVWGYDRERAAQWAPGTAASAQLPSVGYRASVAELCRDARAAGAWREVAPGLPRPQPGDLLVMRRDGQDPRVGGIGHVEVVEDVSGPSTWTVGGNVGDRVSRQQRGPADGVVGWIDIDPMGGAS